MTKKVLWMLIMYFTTFLLENTVLPIAIIMCHLDYVGKERKIDTSDGNSSHLFPLLVLVYAYQDHSGNRPLFSVEATR